MVKTICSGPDAGKGAKIQVWRRPDDASVTTLEVVGGAADVFYDETGREQLRMTKQTVGSGSPQVLEDQQRRDDAIADGKRAERIACP